MQITKKTKETAEKLFKANPSFKKLFVNKKGEFFTSENLCQNALDKDEKYATITPELEVVDEGAEDPEKISKTQKS
ncbi:MAG: hypothetical protein AAFN93_26770 [Bacteroidota bacterium]